MTDWLFEWEPMPERRCDICDRINPVPDLIRHVSPSQERLVCKPCGERLDITTLRAFTRSGLPHTWKLVTAMAEQGSR